MYLVELDLGFSWRVCACVQACSVPQSCQTLGNPMDCRPQSSSVHGTFQAKILDQSATSRNLPDQGIKFAPLVSPAMAGRFFTTAPPGKLLEGSHLGKSRCFMIRNCFMTNSDPQRFQALI